MGGVTLMSIRGKTDVQSLVHPRFMPVGGQNCFMPETHKKIKNKKKGTGQDCNHLKD